MKPIRLLLCDDQKSYRNTIANGKLPEQWKSMYDEDVRIDVCEDIVGSAGVAPQKRINDIGEYDAILLDVVWRGRGTHGIDIAKQVRLRYPEKPIIILSERVTREDFKTLVRLGLSAYIPKRPYRMADWCAQIREVWARTYQDQSGLPLYKALRSTVQSREAWEASAVGEAASEVWRHESPYGKWRAFWEAFLPVLAQRKMLPALDVMKERFYSDELFTLGVTPEMRGHLEHVLNVYFTGYVISQSLSPMRDAVINAVARLLGRSFRKRHEGEYWDLFQFAWLLAATLHDTGYSLEVLPESSGRLETISAAFPFATFRRAFSRNRADEYVWREVRGAKDAFRKVLGRLHAERSDVTWIERNVTFVDRDGFPRFNHGVASGALFFRRASEWHGVGGLRPHLSTFNEWAATAMAVHALKKTGLGKHKMRRVALQSDPLAWLLSISDELQVWNRARPDEDPSRAAFARVDLKELGVSGKRVSAAVEYIRYRGIELDKENHVAPLATRLNEDQKTLGEFLECTPVRVEIGSVVRGFDQSLPKIELV